MSGYLCKSAPIRNHIINRRLQGFTDFEIQVLKDTTADDILELLELSATLSIRIRNIHVDTSVSSNFLESIYAWRCCEVMRACLYVADTIGAYFGEKVNIVTHTDLNRHNIEVHDRTAESIIKTLVDYEKVYPNINISVENLVPVYIENGELIVSSSFNLGNLEVVKYLRDYGIENVFTTVDIAHVKMANNFISLLSTAGVVIEPLTYSKVLEENIGYCNNIHLADCMSLGIKRQDHGIIFKDESEMFEIVSYIGCVLPDANVVLEVIEDNYEYAPNALSMLNTLCKNYV